MRKCSTCDKSEDETTFYKGARKQCRPCVLETNAAYRRNNKEKCDAISREYRSRPGHAEKQREYMKGYYADNKEKWQKIHEDMKHENVIYKAWFGEYYYIGQTTSIKARMNNHRKSKCPGVAWALANGHEFSHYEILDCKTEYDAILAVKGDERCLNVLNGESSARGVSC